MAFVPTSLVTGAIVPGVSDDPTEPTYSVMLTGVTSSGQLVNVPAAARYMDVALCDTTFRYGSGAPVLSVQSNEGRGSPQLVRDYTNGVCIPSYPAPLSGFSNSSNDTGARPNVFVDTTVTCNAMLQFFLEF